MIDPLQLIEIAQALAEAPRRGAPRQAKLRRAVSTAYCALFHFLIDSAVTEILGANPDSPRYRLAYRSFQHKDMFEACQRAAIGLSKEVQAVFEIGTFCGQIKLCAQSFMELQKLRHEADYDPGAKFTLSDTRGAILKAQTAMQSLNAAPQSERRLFLMSLHFKVRT